MASIRARLEAASRSSSDDDDSNSLAPYAAFNSLPTEDSLEQLRRKTTYINGDPGYYERPNSDVEEKAARLGMAKSHCCKCVDITATVAVILVIWIMMAAPTAFYIRTKVSIVDSSNSTCTVFDEPENMCTAHLQDYATCLNNYSNSTNISIAGTPDHTSLQKIFNLLQVFRISQQCATNLEPLICLHFMPLCFNNKVIKPSVKQCSFIREVCNEELKQAEQIPNLNVSMYLSNCTPHSPLDNTSCSDNSSIGVNNSNISTTCPTEGFYSLNGTCVPECNVWSPYSKTTVLVTDILTIFATVVAVISGVAVMLVSCVRHQKMLRYPSIFIVYQTIPTIALAIIVLVGFGARRQLFCRSRSLIESFTHPSVFCILTGVVFYYVVLQLLLWWLWHTIAVFWAVTWPFHARKFNTSRNTKYLHIAFVLASLVLPLAPTMVILFVSSPPLPQGPDYGFTITRAPPFVCAGFDINVNFWAFIFPINLLLAVGATLLFFILRTVVKKHCISKIHKIRVNLNWALELKVLIVLCYYVLLGAAVLTIFTMALTEFQHTVENVGRMISHPNGQTSFNSSQSTKTSTPYSSTVAIMILGFLPAVNFIYVLELKELKNKLNCRQTRQVQYVQRESSRSSRYIPYVINREPISTTLRHGSLTVQTKTTNSEPLISSLSNNDLRQ